MPRIDSESKEQRAERIWLKVKSSPNGIKESEIAEELNLERKTVNNYLRKVLDFEGKVFKEGVLWFPLNLRGTKLRSFNLSPEEAIALYLGARLLAKQHDKRNEPAETALLKLARILKSDAGVGDEIEQAARELAQRPVKKGYPPIFRDIVRGYIYRKKVKIVYKPLGNPDSFETVFSTYLLEPSAVGFSTYLIGHSGIVDKLRSYKLERVQSVQLTNEDYEIPEDFDGLAVLRNAWNIIAGEKTIEVILRFSTDVKERVLETRWHPSQKTEDDPEKEGWLRWSAQVADTKDMLPWIRGWGADVEVLEPEGLRRQLKREARRLAEVYGVRNMKNVLIAHVRESDGEIQTLQEHLEGVSKLAGKFAGKIGLKETGEILGLLHDLGKASNEFQNYIKSATGKISPNAKDYVDYKAKKGKIDHSTAGAQVIFKTLFQKGKKGQVAAQALSLCIASHHSGLIDCLAPDGKNHFQQRIEKSKEQTHAEEALKKLPYLDKILDELLSQSVIEEQFFNKLNSIKTLPESKSTLSFKQGLLVRYMLSCILDADRLNTADFEFPDNAQIRNYGEYHSWDILIQRLDNKIKEFDEKEGKNEIDTLRNDVSQACYDFATKPRGVYQLTVPTGGGKTFSSLRFALHHAKRHKMDRIFYIIPYTSIIDQNADVVRKILEDRDDDGNYVNKVVLEHHSNLIQDDDEIARHKNWNTEKRQKLLSENWDAPIIFTTQVQFLETLFGSGTKSARRMHQLANSIIIFDEIQTIPIRTVHMFNTALKFLVHNCGSTAVLCTATQPLLDKVSPETRALPIDGKIIENEKELFEKLKRVEVFDERKLGNGWTSEEVSKLAEQELQKKGSVLIIVNTKKSALLLYQELAKSSGADIYHLSTKMCPVHRLKVLDEIKEKLDAKEPVICVSTQLIEAGVDIDFGSVIRYLAGLDSITQAAGRCNRNGEREIGNVWIVNPENENIDKLTDIKKGVKVAERILGEFEDDKLGLSAMTSYYKYYFYARKDEMTYNIGVNSSIKREDNLFNLLSRNEIATQRDTSKMGTSPMFLFKQAFQSASREFHAIDSLTQGVIVPYGKDGEKIVNDLCGAFDLEKEYKLIKKAQRYSINLFPHEFKKLADLGAVKEVQEGAGIYYLDYQYYSDKFGWSDDIVNTMELLNI